MMYRPKPIDTSNVILPEDLSALTEAMAENVHEVWAAGRMAEGWTYGDAVDVEHKKTPLLISYAQLAESEKDYDRNTVVETLKMIIKAGYKISRE